MKRVRSTYLLAGAVLLAGLVWLLSGVIGQDNQQDLNLTIADATHGSGTAADDDPEVAVRVVESVAIPQGRLLELRARTQNKSTVEVSAETAGKLVKRAVEPGAKVSEGTLLCEIQQGSRRAELARAQASVEQTRTDYQASLRLKEEGFQAGSAIARALATLRAAEADLAAREIDLERTRIVAPFAGLVEVVHVSVGDFLVPGQSCATVVSLNPMLVVAFASERVVGLVELGGPTEIDFIDGTSRTGAITHVSHVADDLTRTYRVETTLENADYSIRSGMTATLKIELASVPAHWVRTSQFALDDAGDIGVRIVDDKSVVHFVPVTVVRETLEGVWVAGLPRVARIITVGQEYVYPGQVVETVTDQRELPAEWSSRLVDQVDSSMDDSAGVHAPSIKSAGESSSDPGQEP